MNEALQVAATDAAVDEPKFANTATEATLKATFTIIMSFDMTDDCIKG